MRSRLNSPPASVIVKLMAGRTLLSILILTILLNWIEKSGDSQDGNAPKTSDQSSTTLGEPDVRLGSLRWRAGSPVRALAFSPDGSILATGTYGGWVDLWKTPSGELLSTLPFNKKAILALAFSSDGKYLASGGGDSKIRIWDRRERKEVKTLEGHDGWITSLVFTQDADLVSSSEDKTIRIWDVANGKERRRLDAHKEGVLALALSRDGRVLASCGRDKRVIVWDAGTYDCLTILEDGKPIGDVVWHESGKSLVSASLDGTVSLWHCEQKKKVWSKAFDQRESNVLKLPLAISAGGKIAFCSPGGIIRIIDSSTGKELARRDERNSTIGSLSFSPDSNYLATGTSVGVIRMLESDLRDVSSTNESHEGEVLALCQISGSKLASASADGTIRIWDSSTARVFSVLRGHEGAVFFVACSPDGNRLVSASRDKTVRIWDLSKPNDFASIGFESRGGLETVALSHDGKHIAVATSDSSVHVLRVTDKPAAESVKLSLECPANALAFSPNGKYLASGDCQSNVDVWETGKGARVLQLRASAGGVSTIQFFPHGGILAVGTVRGSIHLWEVATGKKIHDMKTRESHVVSLAIREDGRILASATASGEVHVWNCASGQEVQCKQFDRAVPTSVSFSKDKKNLAMGFTDSTVLVWSRGVHSMGVPKGEGGNDEQKFQMLWSDLASDDAEKANSAVHALATFGDLTFISKRLLALVDDPNELNRLIENLDHEDAKTREEAIQILTGIDSQAHFDEALKSNSSPELKSRVAMLQGKLKEQDNILVVGSEILRGVRALQALEMMDTPEARRLIEAVSKKSPYVRLRKNALEVLERSAERGR